MPSPQNCEPEVGHPIKQQSRAVQARWAGEKASEQEIEEYFRSLPLERAFALYDKLKKNFELAGRILAERANQPEAQNCEMCGVSWEEFSKTSRKSDWYSNSPYYKEGSRSCILVRHFCSAACYSYYNNKTQGGARCIPDRGMVPGDNPKNHPRSNSPSQFHDKAI